MAIADRPAPNTSPETGTPDGDDRPGIWAYQAFDFDQALSRG
ncbi:hypothetical protein EV216_1584, partial [Rhodovulum steppense]